MFLVRSGGGKPWYVFYHFVGAVPGSTSLQTTLQRLLKETGTCTVSAVWGKVQDLFEAETHLASPISRKKGKR